MPTLRARLREAFGLFSAGKADVPPRIAARAAEGLLAAMPGYLQGVGLVVKAVSVFAGNHGTDVPSHQGLIIVCDEHTGTPVAVMDGASVTALRTAARAAVAADLLARPEATVLAIIGGGVQGHSHLQRVRRPAAVVVGAGRVAVARGRRSRSRPVTRRAKAMSFEDAVRGADVICLTTDADHPVIEPEWVSPGAHVGSVGNRAELHPGFIAGTVFVEWMGAATARAAGRRDRTAGHRPRPGWWRSGRVVNGDHPGRTNADEITVYKSTGHAIEDAAAARLVLDAALDKGVGLRLPR